ncbi:hypothetical protein TMatcc_005152 [Talaromyces marneffei ATCC 18224]
MTPAFLTRTRQSTAGRTMSTTTSAFSPRAKTSALANSSSSLTDLSAPRPGLTDGTTSVRPATSLFVLSKDEDLSCLQDSQL